MSAGRRAWWIASAAMLCATPGARADGTDGAYLRAQRLVAIDHDRRLNIFCLGQGAPTVLLEAGSGGSTLDWQRVQGRIATTTRVCWYERAGYGFSNPATPIPEVRDAVDDLHRLIEVAHVGPRAVLVGHSSGGLYAVAYAERFPGDVGGLVLVDPGYPGQQDYAAYGLGTARSASLHDWAQGTGLDPGALPGARSRGTPGRSGGRRDRLQRHAGRPRRSGSSSPAAIDASVGYEAANLSEFEFESSFEAIHGETRDDRETHWPVGSLGAMPMVVLTAERHPAPVPGFSPTNQALEAGHDHLAVLSTLAGASWCRAPGTSSRTIVLPS